MQNFNYHTHTYRCGHAIGTEEEYILSAIDNGFEILGFSEHLGFEGWDNPRQRINFKDIFDYEERVNNLKEKYKDKIKILLGYETEHFRDTDAYLLEVSSRVDYLILGQHSLERNDMALDIVCTDKDVREMAEVMCLGIESGLYDIVAHPDYFMLGRDSYSKDCDNAIREIAKAAKTFDIPLELNLKGFANYRRVIDGVEQRVYPFRKAFEAIADVGPKIVLGYDAHSPKSLENRDVERRLLNEFADLNLKIIEKEFVAIL